MTGFGEAIAMYYRNFVKFEGRSSRAEYWWPSLMQIIVYVGLAIVFFATLDYDSAGGNEFTGASGGILIAGVLFALVNILPNLSLSVRRFHDLGQTGWLVLVFFIVNFFIGVAGIAQMIWFAFRGTDGPNQYGPDPYGYDADVFG